MTRVGLGVWSPISDPSNALTLTEGNLLVRLKVPVTGSGLGMGQAQVAVTDSVCTVQVYRVAVGSGLGRARSGVLPGSGDMAWVTSRLRARQN